MKKAALLISILLLASVLWAQTSSGNRYAMVIGNADYPRIDDILPNAINDTNDISAALREMGYQVELKQNLQHLDMVREIDAFIARLRSSRNSEGFFWYAGHAMEIEGENLLLPLNVNLESENLIKATSYSVTSLTRQFDAVRNKINVVVLDACRVPPAVGGGTRSMGDTSRVIKTVPIVPPDLYIIYSTAPGTTASDGTGKRNSPFAEAFLKHIGSTEPLTLMMGHVTSETLSLTGQRQRPYTSGSMGSENIYYSLNPAGGRPSPSPNPQPAPANMVRVEGGTFQMGSPSSEPGRINDEGPQHQVTVSSFYMGKYEVTQREYREVMGTNPSSIKGGDNLPVENVSWYDAVEYCNALSRKEGLTPAYTISGSGDNRTVTWNLSANGYRLPTEAEWEYACRAGTTTAYNTGANINNNTGWYEDNSARSTQEIGRKPANAWGLYDMHGNVGEWCWDWFTDYTSGTQTDPVGASSGSNRVARGGSWFDSAQYVRSACRVHPTPSLRNRDLGFRLVRNVQ
jgi:formylglycine-generating enzyme required for sulfatase activity